MNTCKILILLFALVFISGTPSLALGEPEPSNAPLRVGVILPLTGDAATFGISVKQGMELALTEAPSDTRRRITLIFEDDAFQASKAISAYRKLRSVDKIDALVNAGSSTAKALAPFADRDQVPFLAIASDPAVVRGREHVVNFWVTPTAESAVLHPELIKRGYKRLARVSTEHEFAEAINRSFEAVNQDEIAVVFDEAFPPKVRDFRSSLTKLKSSAEIDAILTILMPGQLGLFARQAREMGISLPLIGYEFFEDPNEVKQSNGALHGQLYVNAGEPSQEFVTRYLARYKGASLLGAANGHDIVLLLLNYMEAAPTPVGLTKFLHSVNNFHGALGVFSSTDNNTFTLPAILKVVTADGFKPLDRDANH